MLEPLGSMFLQALRDQYNLHAKDALTTTRWLLSEDILACELADLGRLDECDVQKFSKGLSKTGSSKLIALWRVLHEELVGDGRRILRPSGSGGGGPTGATVRNKSRDMSKKFVEA